LAARRVLPPDLDHAGERIEALHEGERSGSASAARKNPVFFAQRRKIGARARAPLEQHAFGLGQIENRFERILHRTMKQAEHCGRASPLVSF
jgi:hypothetical protein